MPQPLEFRLSVTNPGPAVGVWEAFAGTLGRVVVPAAGQTSLEDPSSEISSSVRHAAFTEECQGEPLPDERMLTPQFSVAGWADIRPEVRQTYAGVKKEVVASGFAASIALKPSPLTVPALLFRHRPRPDEDRLLPLAGALIEVSADSATVAVTVERWLLTQAIAPYGLVEEDLVRLLTNINDAFRDFARQCPGSDPKPGLVIPTTNLLPALEQLLTQFKADAS
ncbi:MAG TPA: hypothetical protein VE981_22415 [Planctomycetota bacterium]|nr:hypothetical protein [Planctomycetota bacterium]